MVKKTAVKPAEKKLDSISAIDEELKKVMIEEQEANEAHEALKAEAKKAVDTKKELANKKTKLKRMKQSMEIDEAKRKMYEELGINPLTPLVESFYSIAWEDGHSYGMHEVKNHMIDYVEIIAKIEHVHNGLQDLHAEFTSEIPKLKDKKVVESLQLMDRVITSLMRSWSEIPVK